MNTKNIPSKEDTLERFIERFPMAMKHGWILEQSYPGEVEYAHFYQVCPPKDSEIAHWSTMFPRKVSWAGMEIDIPQTFWDDDLLVNHGSNS